MSQRAARSALRPPAVPLLLVVILFVLSGAAGLVYEVIWMRSLTLVFGKTVHAAGAVLAAFMAGLAIGSAFGGRMVDRAKLSPLRIYALLEVGIGVWALALPLANKGLAAIYVALSGPYEQLPALLSLGRFAMAAMVLLPATALMGATLPALSRWAVRHEAEVGSRLGLLYALNTLGGVAGCLAAGFFLLEVLGLAGTTLAAAAGNFVVAGLALLLARRRTAAGGPEAPVARLVSDPVKERPVSSAEPRAASKLWIVMAAVALGGFGALVLEVTWTRALQLVFGSTAYSFSAMLSVFLFGIGLGSLLMTPFADRLRRPWVCLGLLQGGIGVLVLASAHMIDRMPEVYLSLVARRGLTWGADLQVKFLLSAALMLIPTILSGAVWPVAVRLSRPRQESLGSSVGKLYAANTAGSILGSLAGAFAFLPALGMQRTLVSISLVMAAIGAALVWLEPVAPRRRAAWSAAVALLAGTLAVTLAPWDRKMLTSGAYFMPKTFLNDRGEPILRERLKETVLTFYGEGVTTTPTVAILGDVNKAFFNDGKIEGGTAMDGMRLQRILGHLPFLMRPAGHGEARTALNIGLGSGITVGAMGTHPAERIDCAEIEPVVVEAARQFDKETSSILDRPGLRMIYNDGRNHLMLTRQSYDVISSAPFAPLVGGAASLYSLEQFRLVRDRLAPGGMTAQFLPLYQLSNTDFLSIMKTFAQVFPDATVWFTGVETVLVGGTGGPQRFDLEGLSERMREPKVAQSLRQIGLDDPLRLLATYCFKVGDVASELEGIPLNTDDRPRLEFTAPRSHHVNTVRENLPWLIARVRSPAPHLVMPASWAPDDPRWSQTLERLESLLKAQRLTMEGRLKVLRGDLEGGIATLEQAAAIDPADTYARDMAARNLVKLAERRYEAGSEEDSVRAYERALQHDPRFFLALYNLARLVYDRGDAARARRLTEEALAQAPHSPSLNYRMGLLTYNEGNLASSQRYLETAIDLDAAYADPLMVLGDLYRARSDPATAGEMYRRAIERGKRDAEAYAALAQSLLEQKRRDEAADNVALALELTPGYPDAIFTRARLSLAEGRREEAAKDLEAAMKAGGERYRRRALADPDLRELLN